MKKLILGLGATALISISMISCGGGGGGSDSDALTGGPANATALAGSTIAFNPELKFLPGKVLEYVNNENASPFPLSNGIEVGTYNYVPDQGNYSGTLIIDVPSVNVFEIITVDQFITSGGVIQSFRMTFDTEGLFQAIVTDGTILAAGDPDFDNGGGGGGGGEDGSAEESFTYQNNGNIEVGTQFTKTFESTLNTQGGDNAAFSPLIQYPAGSQVSFTIGAGGNLDFTGKFGPISIPFSSASNGILTYQGPTFANGIDGNMAITFNTNAIATPEDMTITWNAVFFPVGELQTFSDPN